MPYILYHPILCHIILWHCVEAFGISYALSYMMLHDPILSFLSYGILWTPMEYPIDILYNPMTLWMIKESYGVIRHNLWNILCHLTSSYPILHYPMESSGNLRNFMDYPLGYPTPFYIILYHPELSYRSLWNLMESYGIS